MLETLEDSLSNSVQLTEMRGTLAESLPTEMEQLLRMYVEPLKLPSDAEKVEWARRDCIDHARHV